MRIECGSYNRALLKMHLFVFQLFPAGHSWDRWAAAYAPWFRWGASSHFLSFDLKRNRFCFFSSLVINDSCVFFQAKQCVCVCVCVCVKIRTTIVAKTCWNRFRWILISFIFKYANSDLGDYPFRLQDFPWNRRHFTQHILWTFVWCVHVCLSDPWDVKRACFLEWKDV